MAHAQAGTVRVLILAGLAAGLAACGSGGVSGSSSTGAKPPTTHLVVTASGRGTKTIDCPGSGLCPRLAKTPASHFDPVPGDVACSQIYGGDQTATVEGTLNGKPLHASFSRQNGCEISRWDQLAWLIGKPA